MEKSEKEKETPHSPVTSDATHSTYQFRDERAIPEHRQDLITSLRDKEDPLQRNKNNQTGLPDQLKSGIESLSGVSMDNVRVHQNSSKPAEVGAHAFAQGHNIHIAPGQMEHLPHEAWHVVQQAQGRVKPTTTVAGMPVNDNAALEKEADRMGAQALQRHENTSAASDALSIQTGVGIKQFGRGKYNSRQSNYKAKGRPQIPKRNKPKDEEQRRRTIGKKDETRRPIRRRGPAPAHNRGPVNPVPQDENVNVNPIPVPVNDDFELDDEQELNPLQNDVHVPDYVAIDIESDDEEEHERGIGERIRDKAFGGRTFGDSSNLLGAVANTIEDTAQASTLLVLGSSGVLTSGFKLLFDGLDQRARAQNDEDRRESTYTLLMGVSNIYSGGYGITSAIAALFEEEALASVAGVISTATWAMTEATNIISQLDILITNFKQNANAINYLKPTAALLASLIKCIGGILYIYGSIVSFGQDEEQRDPTINFGVVMMIIGSAASTLHGIIKLATICLKKCRENNIEVDDDPDLELGL